MSVVGTGHHSLISDINNFITQKLIQTFIRHLLGQDFPGIRIEPRTEPTTDRFIAVMYGNENGVVPGNALVVDPNKQFRTLSK